MIKKLLFLLLLFMLLAGGLFGFYQFFPGSAFKLLAQAERGVAGLHSYTIDIGDLHIAYLDSGDSHESDDSRSEKTAEPIPLVLLHGFGANKDNWTRFAAHLTPHYRVIIPDLIGFGDSGPAPDNDYRIGKQAERLRTFLQALNLKQIHLGGSSMGGYIAGVYAAGYPENTRSLLLISPSGVKTAETSAIDQLIAEGQPSPSLINTPEDYDRLLRFMFVKPPYIPQPIKQLFVQEAITYRTLHNQILTQLDSDELIPAMEDLLRPLSVPTLIIWGDQDQSLHVSGGKILAGIIAGSQLEIREAVGHLPMIEQPEITAQRYLEFLR